MATTALRKKNQLLLAKIETTYDTDPTPTAAANSILALDPSIKEGIDPVRRPAQIGSLSRLGSVDGKKMVEVAFKIEIKGSGTAGTAPRIGPLLRACGFGETIVSNTSVTYLPVSASFESVTIWFYIDGRLHKVTGCRGDVKFTTEAGQFAVAEFTLKGRYAASTLVALPTPTLETTLPAVAKSATFQYNSLSTLVVKSGLIEMNNEVVERPSLNDANSIAGFEITGRDPMLTIDPEMIIETSYAFRTDAFTNQRDVTWVVGSTAGNILTVDVPKFNPYFPEYTDRDEIMVETIKGECAQNSGNDEVSLAFT
jgi:hypothetical protein